jgi:hypothetical protein
MLRTSGGTVFNQTGNTNALRESSNQAFSESIDFKNGTQKDMFKSGNMDFSKINFAGAGLAGSYDQLINLR